MSAGAVVNPVVVIIPRFQYEFLPRVLDTESACREVMSGWRQRLEISRA